ncbi:hypothetical protein [Rhodococcus zopfii]|uniref:hypothetical protein n=1 Tax=Rhodococcus zopfii TaxID=43772 RepID=UPI0011114249|nr:hypothetical protein [Rhodococcus zopfii]
MSVLTTLFVLLAGFLGGAPTYEAAPLTVDCASAPEVVLELGGSCAPAPVRLSAEAAAEFSDCDDTYSVFVDPVTGGICGDQDMNGRLDGDDCLWS